MRTSTAGKVEKNRGLYPTINGRDSASSIFEQIRMGIHPQLKSRGFLPILFNSIDDILLIHDYSAPDSYLVGFKPIYHPYSKEYMYLAVYDPLTKTLEIDKLDDMSKLEKLEDIVGRVYGREHALQVRRARKVIEVYKQWYEEDFEKTGRLEKFKEDYEDLFSTKVSDDIIRYSSRPIKGSLAYSGPCIEKIDPDNLESADIEVIGLPSNENFSTLIYIAGVKTLDQLFYLLTVHELIHKTKHHSIYKSTLDLIRKEKEVWRDSVELYKKEADEAETTKEKAYYNDLVKIAEDNYNKWEEQEKVYLAEKEKLGKRHIKVEEAEEKETSTKETEANEEAEAA